VCCHQCFDAGAGRGDEGHELDSAQAIVAVGHGRQLEMRIGSGIAVPWVVLATAEHLGVVEPAPERQGVIGDHFRSAAERPVADDRVARVGVHVEHRSEVPADTERGQLAAEGASHRARARNVTRRAHRAHVRPWRERGAQALHATALLIGRNHELSLRWACLAQRRNQRGNLRGILDVLAKEHHPADLGAPDAPQKLGRRHEPVEPHREELTTVASDG
jgi:hypothetical protein